MKHLEICLFLWKEEIPTSKGFNTVRICLWTCVLFLKWLYYEIWNFENFICINISYYQDLCHIEKIISFFFLFTNWLKISEESCPKEFSHNILEANKFNMAIPPFFFFFFLTSILNNFKKWQTMKTGKM